MYSAPNDTISFYTEFQCTDYSESQCDTVHLGVNNAAHGSAGSGVGVSPSAALPLSPPTRLLKLIHPLWSGILAELSSGKWLITVIIFHQGQQ